MSARRFFRLLLCGLVGVVFLTGCASKVPPPVEPPTPPPAPAFSLFPPQKVMESGDYAGFFEENQKTLKECGGEGACAVALFNLGFVHAYPGSAQYYSPSKALRYFDDLIEKYPQSPYAFQAKAWVAIVKRGVIYENKCRELQGTIKTKDTAINDMQKQMERSRDIDVEMDRKERELLQ